MASKAQGVSPAGAAVGADLGGITNTQARTLRTEVEKGSMWTAVEHGSVDPKASAKAVQKRCG